MAYDFTVKYLIQDRSTGSYLTPSGWVASQVDAYGYSNVATENDYYRDVINALPDGNYILVFNYVVAHPAP